jgi:ABC-type multidrug transport system ATPase subunit
VTLILHIDQLHFGYPECALFQGLSLQVPAGVTLLRAGDGRGKTTLLRLLAGDLTADAGDLRLNGVLLKTHRAGYQQQVFWVEPRTSDFDAVTATDYFASLHSIYPQWNHAALATLLDGLSLAPHVDKPMYMLSTGSKRKVWLAAAFASGAALTLLDDPLAALDKPSIRCVTHTLAQAAQTAQRAFVVAHYEPLAGVPLAATLDLGD